jgi:hypothetical protein
VIDEEEIKKIKELLSNDEKVLFSSKQGRISPGGSFLRLLLFF